MRYCKALMMKTIFHIHTQQETTLTLLYVVLEGMI